ncbi:MAG: hypothetical protein RIQ81_1042 [Pseudomonadota bacterium]|jgi:hypothetical protein
MDRGLVWHRNFMAMASLGLGLALAGAVSGCKRTSPGGSLRGDYNHGCSCNDLECWRKNSQQGSKDALKCAASSLNAAADIATAGQASNVIFGIEVVAGVFDLAKDISAFASRTYSISQDGLTQVNLAGLLKEIATGKADALKYAFGTSYDKNPKLACWSDITKNAGAVAGLVGSVITLNEHSENAKASGRQFGFAEMGDVAKTVMGGVEASFRFGFALNACITNIMDNSAAGDLKLLHDRLKKFSGYMKAGVALINDCGINMLNSGYVLVQNSACLVGDFSNLMESNSRLSDELDATLNRPAPNPPGDKPYTSCNGEETGCNRFAMQKFGIWLGQQTYFSYLTRSSLCADMCGNQGSGQKECEDYRFEIFQDDAPYCVPVCRTKQCTLAVDSCISFCCGQESGCTDAARAKTNY